MTDAPRGQRLVWVAQYLDGDVVMEHAPDGVEMSFEELDRSRLRRFALADAYRELRPLVVLDCRTGCLHTPGGRLAFELDGIPVGGRADAGCTDVVQWKRAHTSWSPVAGSTGNVVDAHGIGYRTPHPPDGRVEVVLVVPVDGTLPRVEAKVNVPGVREDAFRALLDDRPVRGPRDLATALGARSCPQAGSDGRREG